MSELNNDQLKALIERIGRLEEEKKNIGEDIKEVYQEGKSSGFDTKTLKKIVALMKKDPDTISEEDAMLDLYRKTLGI